MCWRGFIAAVCVSLAGGCLSPHEAAMVDVDPCAWTEGACVEFENRDTLAERDLYLVVRYASLHGGQGDTLRLTVETLAPDSSRCTEQVSVPLPASERAAALRPQSRQLYRRAAVLGQPGRYRITLTPSSSARGVEAVGIDLEPSGTL
ncbi:MAG: hypothetical protein K2O63_07145 [Alistipes sp.]|nr:hypothetical protein [Alistipes sp.]